MKQKILFHVGLHKTATSSLQQDFFVQENNFLQHPMGRSFWLPMFVNKFSTEPLSSADKHAIQNFLDFARALNLTPVVSNERLSGYPLSGGYDRLSIYTRIASLDLDVKILFVMREQKSWLYSAWRQMITDGGSIGIREFLTQKPSIPNVRLPGPRFEYLNYSLEIETLRSLFGRENVLVLPYELIALNFSIFKESLSLLLNEDFRKTPASTLSSRNARKSLTQFYTQWAVNRYLVSSVTSPKGLISNHMKTATGIRSFSARLSSLLPELPHADKIVKRHKKIVADQVGDYYFNINKSSSEALNIDLAELGYDL